MNPLLSVASKKTPTTEQSTEAPELPVQDIIEVPAELSKEFDSLMNLLPEPLLPYWKLLQEYPLLEAAFIVSVFFILAYIIRRYVVKLIHRLASRSHTDVDDYIIDQLRSPLFTSIIWLGVIIATASTGLANGAWRYLTPTILSWLVLVWLKVALVLSGKIFTVMALSPKRFKKIDARTEPLFIIISKILLLLVGSYAFLIIWGINPVGLLASAGIVGIAVGFAAKDTLANLFSGMFILADRPYELGDYVNLDSGERGKVTHIGIRSTRILTRDDVEVILPNGLIGNSKIVNESGGPHQKMRIRLDVQCAYDADLNEVENELMAIAESEELVCQYPAARVRVRGFADSGINIQLMVWILLPEDRGRISHILYKKIHHRFGEAGLEIPYPKRDITVRNIT
jgi:MscS family membrane protein